MKHLKLSLNARATTTAFNGDAPGQQRRRPSSRGAFPVPIRAFGRVNATPRAKEGAANAEEEKEEELEQDDEKGDDDDDGW